MKKSWLFISLLFCAGLFFVAGCCQENFDCPDDSYCMKVLGDCEGVGICLKKPDACDKTYMPVCGCDGKTYDNICEAAREGMCVAYEGECGQDCHSNGGCLEDEYCAKRVGDCEGEGLCAERPDACNKIYDPVCGCDGITYDNACEAAKAGVNIAYGGECGQDCSSNGGCLEDEYCAKRVGDCGGEGICTERPDACNKIYDPVCGCDGKTYSNACEAARAGMSIAYEGECDRFFCPRSKGYWKNHPTAWPVDELFIGGEIYTKEELLSMLRSPSKGDMDLILMQQLIPAKLNREAGADTHSINRVIRQSDNCLESGDCSRNRLENLKDRLDRFNNSGNGCYD